MAKTKTAPLLTAATIHAHFTIPAHNSEDVKTGDVTLEEQIKAIERFVRWHERQSTIGKDLLRKLVAQIPKAS